MLAMPVTSKAVIYVNELLGEQVAKTFSSWSGSGFISFTVSATPTMDFEKTEATITRRFGKPRRAGQMITWDVSARRSIQIWKHRLTAQHPLGIFCLRLLDHTEI